MMTFCRLAFRLTSIENKEKTYLTVAKENLKAKIV